MINKALLFPFFILTLALQGQVNAINSETTTLIKPDEREYSNNALSLGRDLDGDGDADEIDIHLEIIEIQEEVYPGEKVTFWVFAPEGEGMKSIARLPSPTIRVEEGDRVRITLHNTHYLPHTIHLHGTIHPNSMDGVPVITQPAVNPGESFTYEFVAKNTGTFFYHCHVQADIHVPMGLSGMLIIEPNRPDNQFSHLVIGAGRIKDMSKATMEQYQREYSLVYMEIDDLLHKIPETTQDPREIEKRMHREYDSTKRQPNIFLLNGRSFPFTLRDTPIVVGDKEKVKLRLLNAGERVMNLHTHGHHPTITHLDGYELKDSMKYARDVFMLGASQRLDIALQTGKDNYYSSGPGVWLMHDHTESTTTNKGINPGGDITTIVYQDYMGTNGLPKTATSLKQYFNPEFYQGKIPVFDPSIFHSTYAEYEEGWGDKKNAAPAYPIQDHPPSTTSASILDSHKIAANSCKKARGFRQIHIKAGSKFARKGEVFGFEPRVIKAAPCEELEIILENTDTIRHSFMLPGLNPMYNLEFRGPGIRKLRFITPDKDITLEFHCHISTHEKMGMHGKLIVGKGTTDDDHAEDVHEKTKQLHEGIGVLISLNPRNSRVVIDHEEIKDFMAPMVMSYKVISADLLQGLQAKDKISFVFDAKIRAIVKITVLKN